MNNRLSIKEVAGQLSVSTGKSTEELEHFLREFVEIGREGLMSDRLLQAKGIGNFKIILVEKRESIDVNTKERILIPEHYKLSFVPDKEMREIVNKPFSFFDTIEIEEGTESKPPAREENSVELPGESETEETEEVEDDIEEEEEEKPVVVVKEIEPVEQQTEPELPSQAVALPEKELVITEKETEVIKEDNSMAEQHPHENKADYSPENERRREDRQKAKKDNSNLLLIILSAAVVVLMIAVGSMLFLKRHQLFPSKDKNDDLKKEIAASPHTEDGFELPPSAGTSESLKQDFGSGQVPLDEKQAYASTSSPRRGSWTERHNNTYRRQAGGRRSHTVTVRQGDRLNLLALQYYGNKVFWVYIYQANKAKIDDPDVIPVGITLNIPAAAKYGIDARSAVSLRKAYALQEKILNARGNSGAYAVPQNGRRYNRPASRWGNDDNEQNPADVSGEENFFDNPATARGNRNSRHPAL
ncbi:MAG: HU family DNA-binding protein [Tannerella sp.]|jgi:nucleoid-associated protein YgaU/nucleoid DNA-binding protein|nr:HU family DNA-binding protein [Tannerella sp.]